MGWGDPCRWTIRRIKNSGIKELFSDSGFYCCICSSRLCERLLLQTANLIRLCKCQELLFLLLTFAKPRWQPNRFSTFAQVFLMPGIAWPLFPEEVTDRYEREDEPVNDHHCYGCVRRRGIEGRVEQCLRRCTRRGIVNDHCQWAAHKCIINRTTWNNRLLRVGSQYSNSTLVVNPSCKTRS